MCPENCVCRASCAGPGHPSGAQETRIMAGGQVGSRNGAPPGLGRVDSMVQRLWTGQRSPRMGGVGRTVQPWCGATACALPETPATGGPSSSYSGHLTWVERRRQKWDQHKAQGGPHRLAPGTAGPGSTQCGPRGPGRGSSSQQRIGLGPRTP